MTPEEAERLNPGDKVYIARTTSGPAQVVRATVGKVIPSSSHGCLVYFHECNAEFAGNVHTTEALAQDDVTTLLTYHLERAKTKLQNFLDHKPFKDLTAHSEA